MHIEPTPGADIFVDSNRASAAPVDGAAPAPLTVGRVFWAIFGALWAYSLSAAILYFLYKALTSSWN